MLELRLRYTDEEEAILRAEAERREMTVETLVRRTPLLIAREMQELKRQDERARCGATQHARNTHVETGADK